MLCQRMSTSHEVKRCSFPGPSFGQCETTIREIESGELMLALNGSFVVMPVQSACHHQVQDEPVIRFKSKDNAFADAAKLSDSPAVGGAKWWIETAHQERLAYANIVENLPADPLIDFLDIEIDVGKFGHSPLAVYNSRQSGLTSHTGATDAAIAARIFREILLVIFFGVVQFTKRCNFSRDRAVAGGAELLLVGVQ